MTDQASRSSMVNSAPGRPSRLLAAVTLAVATMAAGCSFIPKYERPAAPIADTYPAAVQPAVTTAGTAPADVAWQDFFGDARLKRLIELSLANNRDLRIAVLNIEQARATFQIRRADLFPTVNVGASATGRAPCRIVVAGHAD